jgi:hypothetical protein
VTLAADALAELAKTAPEIYPVLDLVFLSQTLRLTSVDAPVASSSLGPYLPRVTAWGDIVRSASDSGFGIVAMETELEVSDLDGTLSSLIEATVDRATVTARIRYASPNIAETVDGGLTTNWPVMLTGIATKFRGAAASGWKLTLRTNDDKLTTNRIPHLAITPFDFPSPATTDVWGLPVPLVYGMGNASDGTPGDIVGAFPAYYVNAVSGNYLALAGGGEIHSIERVFVDGVLQSTATWDRRTYEMPGFQLTRIVPPYVGRRMTFIKFTDDPGPNAVITWDGIGLCRWHGWSYAAPYLMQPLTNPALQMRHFLNNFVLPPTPWVDGPYFDWTSTAWVDNALFDIPSWDYTASWFEARGYRGARWIGGSVTDGRKELAAWAETHGLSLYWTATGKLAVKPIAEPGRTSVYLAAPWLKNYRPETIPQREDDDGEVATEVSGDSWRVPSTNRARATISSRDDYRTRITRSHPRAWATLAPALPVETLDGPTAVYLSDRNTQSAAGDLLYEGAGVATWRDLKSAGTAYDLTQATGAAQPLVRIVEGRVVHYFDGARYMDGTAWPNLGGAALSCFVTFMATANGGTEADANCWNNPALVCDRTGYWGLHHQYVGGKNYLTGHVYIPAVGPMVAKVPIALNTWYVAAWIQKAGVNYLSVRNVAGGASIAVAAYPAAPGNLRIGASWNAAALFQGYIHAVIFHNTDLWDQGPGYESFFGAGMWHHALFEGLADMWRLPESAWM